MARVLRRPGEPELDEGMRLLDRYTILDRIGSGGMATIYRATDDRLDRVVCVKLLRTTLVEGSGSTSGRAVYEATYTHFLKEALALSKLSHANTLRIYDFGYVDDGGEGQGAPFHVSEYLDGGNLETHVRLRGPLPATETFGILEGIADAVAEAHEHGIIHRDIKPSNILFARVRGELVPKLADFGIAHSDIKKKAHDTRDPGASVSTVALFSPRWAAPEQLCGSPEGPRTDVYALALLTVFTLSGAVLFGDEDVRTTFNDRVRGDTLVRARLANLSFPRELGHVLEKALLARPDDRTATAPDYIHALREALRVRPSSSAAPVLDPRARKANDASEPSFEPLPIPAEERQQIPRSSSIALEVESSGKLTRAPVEHVVTQGERVIRYVQVHEKLDLSFLDREGGQVRVRVTMLPGPSPSLNVKGLTCFVARRGSRPTPALTSNQDGAADLVSTGRQMLGELTWSFGQAGPTGRVFLVDGRQLLIPYADAPQAIALMLSGSQDIVMMCRRTSGNGVTST